MRRVLVFGPSWLGDVVMAIPVFRDLRRAYPDVKITVLARSAVAGLYSCIPEVDDVVLYRRQKGLSKLVYYAELIGELQKTRADLALILPRSFGSAWTALLTDVPKRIGYASAGRNLLLTEAVPREEHLLKTHRVHYMQHLLGSLGIATSDEPPVLSVTPEGEADAQELLEPLAEMGDGPVVILNPGANYGTAKQWPEDRYAQLGRELRREYDARLVMVGAGGDRDVCDRIRHDIDKDAVLDVTGQTSLPALVSVIRRADLMVTNDTGAMHVAAAVPIPVIAVFGSTDPITTGPYGAGHEVVIDPVDCAPCLLRTCPIDHRCMVRIDPGRVMELCRTKLRSGVAPAVGG